MKRSLVSIFFMLVMVCPALFAQQSRTVTPAKASAPAEIAEVIRRFAAAESENKIARNNYTFTQDFDLMTVG
ncbi:MAG TPA: hypothetical protein VIS78_13805, partial [Blastocatellia bacterium]